VTFLDHNVVGCVLIGLCAELTFELELFEVAAGSTAELAYFSPDAVNLFRYEKGLVVYPFVFSLEISELHPLFCDEADAFEFVFAGGRVGQQRLEGAGGGPEAVEVGQPGRAGIT
jgi:hypothetical protein